MVNAVLARRSPPKDAVFTTWAAPDGWPLRRMEWRQTGPARGSLLFVNGRGDFIEKYVEAYRHWHERGWNVAAFDWRGQGRSQGASKPSSFDPLIDDLAALLADWRGGTPGPHVAVAHSLGAHLLLRMIVERKPLLDAAVLVAAMIGVNSHPFPPWVAPDLTDLMSKIGFRDRPMWKVAPETKLAGGRRNRNLTTCRERYEDEMHWWAEAPEFDIGAPSWGWMRAAYRSAEQAFRPELLREVQIPVLLLAAERDRLVSLPEIQRAADQLGRGELHVYPEGAHEILREADPVRLDALARIDAFFEAHAS